MESDHYSSGGSRYSPRSGCEGIGVPPYYVVLVVAGHTEPRSSAE